MKTFLILGFWSTAIFGQYFDSLYSHPAREGVLDSTPKSFLVTGYSTSHQPFDAPWPKIFQEMLNQHAGNDTTYFVYRHTVGGTPISKWTDICGNGQHIFDALNNYVQPGELIPEGSPKATIMLAQQSLQWAFNDCDDRFIGIEGPEDEDKIQLGADAILNYMSQFLDGGIEEIYMATHIYKTGAYPLNLDGEKYALMLALDSLNNFYPGPELFEITKSLFPDGFAADMVHPGPRVANSMALYWYLVVAGETAKIEVMQPVADAAGLEVPQKANNSGLILNWTFDGITGNFLEDFSGNYNDGITYGEPILIDGLQGGAVSFDGQDDFAALPDTANLPPDEISDLVTGTISIWFKYFDVTNDGITAGSLPILYFGENDPETTIDGPNNDATIYIGHGKLEDPDKRQIYFTVHNNDKVVLCFDSGEISLVENEWYHFVVNVSPDSHTAYINGEEFQRHYNAGTNSNDYGFFSSVPTKEALYAGNGSFGITGQWWLFNGAIDDIKIYDRYLSEHEVQNLYQAGQVTAIKDDLFLEAPGDFELKQNYPNPFNPTTTINFTISHTGFVSLKIYSIAGRELDNLLGTQLQAGTYSVKYQAENLSSGLYFYQLETEGGASQIRKMIFIK